ncbi:inositol-tetrakisphosphate 1-kinase 6 isoform X2 [Aristolochia californica]|uniref:inositol-tetrakisphosphate 1-kinase 6 isoform X2 n=1 Tax=Aristolochia californica TaxID=171875 RepID=UPI0035E3468F
MYFISLLAISYVESVSSSRVVFVKNMATQYSFDLIMFNISGLEEALNKILLSWGGAEGRYFYLTFRKDEVICLKLRNPTWTIILRASEDGVEDKTQQLVISKVEELPLMLSRFNKLLLNDQSVLTVGYVMKPSREQDFLKRGAFPMCPTHNGLMFIPLSFDVPLVSQIKEVDVVLHKATDEIIKIDPHKFFNCSQGITFSKGMQELRRCIEGHPTSCMIDPIDNIYLLLDRLRIQQILLGLENINMENHCRIRAPHFLKVDTFDEPDLAERLAEAELVFPYIVKPQVACGVAYAHDMAIVFQIDDFKDLKVPLPAIVQEYVDHGSFIYKFYILGEKVFYAIRQSTPNANMLLLSSRENGSKPIIFDSLKSLPKAQDHWNSRCGISSDANSQVLDVDLVTKAAHWLRRTLNLTILGFDVVIQEGTGDHVVVDVNYLPSFKEIPDEVAVPAFWDALKSAYETAKSK